MPHKTTMCVPDRRSNQSRMFFGFLIVAGLLTGWASTVLFVLGGLGLIALALIVGRVLN